MPIEIHAMGAYWEPDRDERTDLGELVHRAKERDDSTAYEPLAARFASFLVERGWDDHAVVPMPASPDRPSSLLEHVADRGGTNLVVRRHPTVRLRDLAPAERPAAARAAGYEVVGDVAGMDVVLLDDVVLTGTTLRRVGGLLLDAGASSVTAVALARSRRR